MRMTPVVHYVADGPSPHQKSIGQKLAVAAPRNSLGTHESDAFLARDFFQLFNDTSELRRQHEVGIRAKGADFPSGVRRVRRRFAKTAEIAVPKVFHADRLQRLAECLSVKMWKASRRRPAAHVDQQFNSMRFQQRYEIVATSRRMADRMNGSKTVAIHGLAD